MKCPFCDTAMESGRVEIKSSFPARPALLTELEFASDAGPTLVPKLGNVALYCSKCDSVILRGSWVDRLECFECHQTIPEDADACPSCGWTWEKNRRSPGYRDPP
jgi:hypothetical protein